MPAKALKNGGMLGIDRQNFRPCGLCGFHQKRACADETFFIGQRQRTAPRHVERIVNTVFEEVIAALSRGDRVELRGFGAFSVKERDARTGRNPRTGESVEVDEKRVPFFKTGKLLRDRLNGHDTGPDEDND